MLKFIERVVGTSDGAMMITSPPYVGAPGWIEVWSNSGDFNNIEEAALKFGKKNLGTYFSLGRFHTNEKGEFRRKQLQCNTLKSFWLDIDAGEDKFLRRPEQAYRTQEEALIGVVQFVKASKLPKPTYIVSSGEGLHVYWVTDTHIPAALWKDAAYKFAAVGTYFGLKIDSSQVGNLAGAPRVPGSLHKSGYLVEVLREGDDVSAAEFFEKIDFLVDDHSIEVNKREVRERDKDKKYPVTFFKNIIGLGDAGCAQLNHAYAYQDVISEPIWWGALSIAEFCEDRDEWIHAISENHPDYTWENTEAKASHSMGPRSCAGFAADNPEGCKGCPHKTKFGATGSPISLGVEVITTPITVENVFVSPEGKLVISEIDIPAYPPPFKRGVEGGVIATRSIQVKGEDGQKERVDIDVMICPEDFYLYERVGDDAGGAPRFWARHHTPHDGVKQFEVGHEWTSAAPVELRKLLSSKSIFLAEEEDYKDMSRFIRHMAMKLQQERASKIAPQQMGWSNHNSFVLGAHEFDANGSHPCPVGSTEKAKMMASCVPDFIGHMTVDEEETKVAEWNALMQEMYGEEEASIHRLVLASAIGCPVRCRHGLEKGGIFNLFTEFSGAGKTTLITNAMGYYLNMDAVIRNGIAGGTVYAFMTQLAYINSLPLFFDEIGQLASQDVNQLRDLIHSVSSGVPKSQGSSSVADIRERQGGWKTFVYSASNVSIWNAVSAAVEKEAHLMRVVEMGLPMLASIRNGKTRGEALKRRANELKGCCAPRLLKYIIENDKELLSIWTETSARLNDAAGLQGSARYWGELMCSAVVGAHIGAITGTFPFDPAEVEATAVRELKRMAKNAEERMESDADLMAEFLDSSIRQICIMTADAATLGRKYPNDECSMRVETHRGKLWIAPAAMTAFAKKRGFDVGRLESFLTSLGGTPGVRKRLLGGTPVEGANIQRRCWEIDVHANPAAEEYFSMDAFSKMVEDE